jgi:hypothetical protein
MMGGHHRPTRWGVATLLALAGCGDAPPGLSLVLRDGSSVPPRADLDRLEGRLARCASAADQSFELPVSEPPSASIQLALEPGEQFALWLRGWRSCAGPCMAPEAAPPGACVCVGDRPERQVSAACTPWSSFEPNLTLNLRLGPVDDACPPPRPGGC